MYGDPVARAALHERPVTAAPLRAAPSRWHGGRRSARIEPLTPRVIERRARRAARRAARRPARRRAAHRRPTATRRSAATRSRRRRTPTASSSRSSASRRRGVVVLPRGRAAGRHDRDARPDRRPFRLARADGGPLLLVARRIRRGAADGDAARTAARMRPASPRCSLYSARTWDEVIFRDEMIAAAAADPAFAFRCGDHARVPGASRRLRSPARRAAAARRARPLGARAPPHVRVRLESRSWKA